MTLVTVLFMPEEQIWFGVLTLIGSCMLLMVPLEKLLRHVPVGVGLAASAALFTLLRNVNQGTLGFEDWTLGTVPEGLYRNLLTAYIGFPPPDFFSTDYFSLLPWLFLFLAGHFLRRLLAGGVETGRVGICFPEAGQHGLQGGFTHSGGGRIVRIDVHTLFPPFPIFLL